MDDRKHWDAVYTTKGPENVSWFRPHLERSLAFLEAAQLGQTAAVIDVGGAVLRFSPEALQAEFGSDFAKISSTTEMHTTPWGVEQEFVYCYCRLPES
jgi:hypothetical protein